MPGHLSEIVKKDDVEDASGGDSEVVGSGADLEVGSFKEFDKQGIVAENEKEGGEWTALFDTIPDVDGSVRSDGGRNPDIRKQVLNGKGKPRGESLFGEGGKDKVVADGVEGLSVVGEKRKELFSGAPFRVEFVP